MSEKVISLVVKYDDNKQTHVVVNGELFSHMSEALETKHQALVDAAIDFIDQMRVQGYDKRTLPAEYDTLVDLVKGERTHSKGK